MTSSRTPCKKAKLLRIERKQNKLLAQGKTQKEIEAIFKENKQQNHTKSIEELFDEMYSATNRFKVGYITCFIKLHIYKLVLSPIFLIFKELFLNNSKKISSRNALLYIFILIFLEIHSIIFTVFYFVFITQLQYFIMKIVWFD